MRAAVLVAVLSLATVSLASKEDVKNAMQTCAKELDVKMGENGFPDKEDAEKKCMAKCVGEKLGMIDASGNVDESKIPDDMKEIIKTCAAEATDGDMCKKASAMQKCLMSKFKKN